MVNYFIMVVIINLNMAIDKTLYIPNFTNGMTARKNPDLVLAGGKGVNVARALKSFMDDYLLMGFCSGYSGRFIMSLIKKEGLKSKIVYQNDYESRTCVSVIDKNGVSTDLNEEGAYISRSSQNKFFDAFKKTIEKADLVSISGRTPYNIKGEFYRKLISEVKKNNKKIFVDLTDESLKTCLEAGVNCVKINAKEFYDFSGMKISEDSIKKIFIKYKKNGLETLIVTNGPEPSLAINDNCFYEVLPPKIDDFVSGVGAGDSFMAGFIYSQINNYNFKKALSTATAFASSDCKTLGAGIISKNDIKKYYDQIRIKEIRIH
ncbi:MAG: hexose kinase [Elusimicrobia bacterium]|nr:hexose kinase [Elusimicrobiota bacterium]